MLLLDGAAELVGGCRLMSAPAATSCRLQPGGGSPRRVQEWRCCLLSASSTSWLMVVGGATKPINATSGHQARAVKSLKTKSPIHETRSTDHDCPYTPTSAHVIDARTCATRSRMYAAGGRPRRCLPPRRLPRQAHHRWITCSHPAGAAPCRLAHPSSLQRPRRPYDLPLIWINTYTRPTLRTGAPNPNCEGRIKFLHVFQHFGPPWESYLIVVDQPRQSYILAKARKGPTARIHDRGGLSSQLIISLGSFYVRPLTCQRE
jgi:hypothetical protein